MEPPKRAHPFTPVRLHALQLLCDARATAEELDCSVWEFACQLPTLQLSGITETTLRWLLKRTLAEHRIEEPSRNGTRRFGKKAGLRFDVDSCFVLSNEGSVVAAEALDAPGNPNHPPNGNVLIAPPASTSREDRRPRWDAANRTLRLGNAIVKQFRVPARNQELILAAFQEENWPEHLDDPLPPSRDIDPKQRLHDAISRLNRNQACNLIHFEGDGTGRGMRWRLRQPTRIAHRSTAHRP